MAIRLRERIKILGGTMEIQESIAEICRQALINTFGDNVDDFVREMRAAESDREKIIIFRRYERKCQDERSAKAR
jgi:hypothetical protein